MIGVGGSGKQSLTKFATFIMEYKKCEIEIVKGFNKEKFREHLKEFMRESGIEGKQ